MAFFDERVEKGIVAKLQGIVESEFVRMDYGEAISILERVEGEVRVPGEMGRRPAVRARALPHREAREEAGHRDELPEGHQGVLHAPERRRQDGRRDGRARAGNRRDHRRQPARGAPRPRSTRAWPKSDIDKESLGWYRDLRRYGTRAARRLRPGLRAHRRPTPPGSRTCATPFRSRARPGTPGTDAHPSAPRPTTRRC